MARQDNPFSLLGDDDDGGDVAALLLKVEAKISAAAAAAAAGVVVEEKPKSRTGTDGFLSKPLPPERMERGRGRGGRGRGLGRTGFRSGSTGGADDDAAVKFVSEYLRGFGSDSGGRGRGYAGGRGGRGRGRGRGFHEGQGFDNADMEIQGKGGDGLDERADALSRYELVENREPRYESRKFGDEQKSSGWEEKNFDSDNRRFRGAEGRERRGFGGGKHGYRGGVSQRYVEREPVLDGKSDGWNESQIKEDAPKGKDQTENNALTGDDASGWNLPATTNIPKGAEADNADQKQLVAQEALVETNTKEEDNEMTLHEYAKVLQEKRKALVSLKIEERKVVVDKDFESMQLVERKKEDDFIKLSVSINEFLKPAEGERYIGPSSGRGRGSGGRGRGRGDRGGYRGGYSGRGGHDAATALHFEDPTQFPLLGAAAKKVGMESVICFLGQMLKPLLSCGTEGQRHYPSSYLFFG
ncbi:RGG repeats nuclear RNA binding protein A-like isoform X2 [Musa acuminata AAA Group]|uniref:RGG repeats nuclear RNA binding protein A isoform X2 n=1 Tax=Musa acuminata AAA Group TaxID=214697 RepID=UPI0031E4476D